MKRFSTLDTSKKRRAAKKKLADSGFINTSKPRMKKTIAKAKKDLEEYKASSEEKLKNLETDARNGQILTAPTLDEPPKIAEARKIPENLSGYVTFLHPWMDEVLNQLVLMLMFLMLFVSTLIVLRLKDSN